MNTQWTATRSVVLAASAMLAAGAMLATSAALAAPPDSSAAASPGADEVGQWYLTPQAGGTFVDSDRHVDDAPYYGVAIGSNLSEDWSAELNIITGHHDGEHGAPDLRITAVSADALRVFDRDAIFSPFLTAGLGFIVDNSVLGTARTNLLAQAGAGLLIHAWQSGDGSSTFDVRPQFKVRFDDLTYGHPLDVLVGVGFQFGFGAPVTQHAEAAPPPPPVAAASPPPPPPPPPAPPPAPVRQVNPKCPYVPPGVAVDAEGCPLRGSITLEGVHFATNSSMLTPESSAVLDPVAASLRAHPRLRIEVQGHTDGVASQAYNLKLSQARADSVRDYLVAHGVDAAELTAKGYGKLRPIATNKTAAGRALNRRVVLVVLENPGDVEVKQGSSNR